MTTMTMGEALEPAAHGHAAEAHGHEEAHDVPGMNRLGLLLFMASETMLFLAMAAARFYGAGMEKGEVNLGLGLGMTAILLASSWLGYRATAAIARGNRAAFMRSIALAAVLGVVFIGAVAYEWTSAPFKVSEPYGTAFYSMTGLHVFHLFQGLLGLVGLLWLGSRGKFGPGDHWGVTAVVRFWTFVDVMWLVVVFPVLYIL